MGNADPDIAAIYKKRITDAAGELFSSYGYERVTVDQIAESAGCTKRTLYSYYASKEAIQRAIVLEGFRVIIRSFDETLANNDALDFSQMMESMVTVFTNEWRTNRYRAEAALHYSLPREYVASQDSVPGDIDAILKAGYELEELIGNAIARGIASGELREDLDVHAGAMTLWAGLAAMTAMSFDKSDYLAARYGKTPNEFLNAGANILLHGILKHDGGKRGLSLT